MKTRLIHAALFTPLSEERWGLPLLLWGAPGVAKTATVRAVARALGWHCEVLSPGERGEGAFGVTPVPDKSKSGTVLRYPPPEWVEALRREDGVEEGLVFLDELNTAPPALQPALLGAIQERRVGGHTLGPRVRVLGAANPVSQAAGGWDLAAPVANRLGHIDWPAPDAVEWGEWLIGGATAEAARDPHLEEEMVRAAWPTAWALASGQVSAFLHRRPELLHKMPQDGDPAQSRAWPSPRTWEYATRALAGARIHTLDDAETEELVAAFIGTAPAGELMVWLAEQALPDPAKLLDGEAEWAPDFERLDRTEAVLGACTALVVPQGAARRVERAGALWGLLATVSKEAKDVTVPAATALAKAGLVAQCPTAIKVLAGLHLVVEAGKE
jgi:MoxR-like ATPase